MLFSLFTFVALAAATPLRNPYPYSHVAPRAAVANFTEEALTVDLGYSVYRGYVHEKLYTFNG